VGEGPDRLGMVVGPLLVRTRYGGRGRGHGPCGPSLSRVSSVPSPEVFTFAQDVDTALTPGALTGSIGFVSTFPQQTSPLMGGTCARMCR